MSLAPSSTTLTSWAAECTRDGVRVRTPETADLQHVDIAVDIAALRALLRALPAGDGDAVERAVANAQRVLAAGNPNRDLVGQAVDRALEAAKRSHDFTPLVPALQPHIQRIVAWLGRDWSHIEATLNGGAIGRINPIELVPNDARWPRRYAEEAAFLRSEFGPDVILRTEHFGSTAVPDLVAKAVIDILVEVPSFDVAERVIEPALKAKGYGCMWSSIGRPAHIMFAKGYGLSKGKPGEDDPLKYHLHMAPGEHPIWDCLYFRDYLRRYPQVARQYADLKLELARRYHFDREGYTRAKTVFVRQVTERAKAELLPS